MSSHKELAAERAEKYAPVPANSSLMAGLVAASIISVLLAIFSGFYSVSAARNWLTYSALVSAGFFSAYIYALYRWRRHRLAAGSELAKIDRFEAPSSGAGQPPSAPDR